MSAPSSGNSGHLEILVFLIAACVAAGMYGIAYGVWGGRRAEIGVRLRTTEVKLIRALLFGALFAALVFIGFYLGLQFLLLEAAPLFLFRLTCEYLLLGIEKMKRQQYLP